jgi:hypothetical protein
VVLHGLGEHRQEEHRGERDHRGQHAEGQGEGGLTVAEQGEVDGGLLSVQGPAGVGGQQDQTRPERQHDGGAGPAGDGGPARAVQPKGEPDGQQHQPDGVEPGGDEQAAQGGAERGTEEEQQSGGDRDPATHALLGQQQAHRQRHQGSADQALHGAGGDQDRDVRRCGAQRGRCGR